MPVLIELPDMEDRNVLECVKGVLWSYRDGKWPRPHSMFGSMRKCILYNEDTQNR